MKEVEELDHSDIEPKSRGAVNLLLENRDILNVVFLGSILILSQPEITERYWQFLQNGMPEELGGLYLAMFDQFGASSGRDLSNFFSSGLLIFAFYHYESLPRPSIALISALRYSFQKIVNNHRSPDSTSDSASA